MIINYFLENSDTIRYFFSILFGGGIIWKVMPWLITENKKKNSFYFEMKEINKQNRILAKRLGKYVSRPSLDAELNKMLNGRYRVCAIKGSAGSGKTRFALNIIKKNMTLSKYYFVYINKSNAGYFDSDEFKNLNAIRDNMNYVFIFDYVYENVNRINSLIRLTEQTRRHKFILIE